jgi:hypothetical protein
MFRPIFASALIALGLIVLPVQAQTVHVSCTTADLTKMSDEASKMTDATKKAEVMKEMAMATDMTGKKDEKACVTHMNNAMKLMPNKT